MTALLNVREEFFPTSHELHIIATRQVVATNKGSEIYATIVRELDFSSLLPLQRRSKLF